MRSNPDGVGKWSCSGARLKGSPTTIQKKGNSRAFHSIGEQISLYMTESFDGRPKLQEEICLVIREHSTYITEVRRNLIFTRPIPNWTLGVTPFLCRSRLRLITPGEMSEQASSSVHVLLSAPPSFTVGAKRKREKIKAFIYCQPPTHKQPITPSESVMPQRTPGRDK